MTLVFGLFMFTSDLFGYADSALLVGPPSECTIASRQASSALSLIRILAYKHAFLVVCVVLILTDLDGFCQFQPLNESVPQTSGRLMNVF